MGCLKISYDQEREAIKSSPLKIWRGIEKKGATLKKRYDYYPFGLTFNEYQNQAEQGNDFLYQGKEIQSDLELNIYDFEARMYDPVLGRTFQLDPHLENYYNWSPYSWSGDNPINMIDPTGMDWYQAVDEEGNVTSTKWREGSEEIEGYENIGANYTMDLGNGVTIAFNQSEAVSMTETALNEDDWETQREPVYDDDGNYVTSQNKPGQEGNCFYQAGQMVSNSGATSIDSYLGNNNITGTDDQINYINAQVSNGNSVRVHVDYNGDGVGDHWVSISSTTTNLQTNNSTHNFYDPGTVWQQSGTSNNNTFNVNNGSISGTTEYSGSNYTIVAVRRNQ